MKPPSVDGVADSLPVGGATWKTIGCGKKLDLVFVHIAVFMLTRRRSTLPAGPPTPRARIRRACSSPARGTRFPVHRQVVHGVADAGRPVETCLLDGRSQMKFDLVVPADVEAGYGKFRAPLDQRARGDPVRKAPLAP